MASSSSSRRRARARSSRKKRIARRERERKAGVGKTTTSSRGRSYTPVSRASAKVGDIKSVSKSGRSRKYWTTKDLKSRSSSSSSSLSSSSSKSSGGSSPATQEQKNQLASLQKTLASLQAKKAGGGGSSPAAKVNAGYQAALDSRDTSTRGVTPATTYASPAAKVNAGYAAALAANKGTKIDTGSSIPSTALSSTLTPQDVIKKQQQLAEAKTKLGSLQEQLAELKRVSELDPTALDPNETINDVFDQEKTDAEKKRDQLLERYSSDTESFYKDRSKDIEGAYNKFGVSAKQDALAEIQKERADRSVKLRNDIQALETAPEFRGVSRGFANDQREAIKSKGSFDLANLAIVESAYAGDVNQSRALAQEMIDTQFDEYQGKMESYKAQLAALAPQLNEDQKRQALQIEIALDNRTRSLEEKKADTELKYEYATAVASLGAPLSVTRSILNATSADEAFMLAAPYMREGGGETTTTTRAGDTAVSPTGVPYPAGNLSPYNLNQGLYDTDPGAAGTTVKELEAALRTTFAPEFTAKLLSSLTSEQTRDFLAGYKEASMKAGMNIDPDYALQEYLTYIEKTPATTTASGEERSAYD